MSKVRYHVQLDSHRTTVSLDKILSEFMAIKLSVKPGTAAAHAAVRQKIDEFIERDRGRSGYGLARYVTEQAVLFIADTMLSEQYWRLWIGEE
jgi:hypothetical protein